ncbi:MAG TPA: GxxExxY protein [Bacteroidia bacterium]|jgi:GxxExxY protein
MKGQRSYKVKKEDLLYPELSFKIVGLLFEVCNKLEYGYLEKHYCDGMAALLKQEGIPFQREVKMEIKLGDEVIASGRADFIIDRKIVLEMKKGRQFKKNNIGQLHSYLKALNMELGILANFTPDGLIFKRIVNTNTNS